MSPLEARRAVGQPDIVGALEWLDFECERDYFGQDSARSIRAEIERLRSCEEALAESGEIIIELKQEEERLRHDIERHVGICAALVTENARLATALRAVRACTDPKWANQIIRDALREGDGT